MRYYITEVATVSYASWIQPSSNTYLLNIINNIISCIRCQSISATSGNGDNLIILVRITGFLDFVHRPVFWKTREHNVSGTGSVSFFRWARVTQECRCLSLTWGQKKIHFPKSYVLSSFFKILDDGHKSKNPVILSVIHHRLDPLECAY
jgi:hypothetical protein